jgi:hypothetical protein
MEEIPHLPVPLHTVIQFIPRGWGTEETRQCLLDTVVVDK